MSVLDDELQLLVDVFYMVMMLGWAGLSLTGLEALLLSDIADARTR